jgi:hypothetical protein
LIQRITGHSVRPNSPGIEILNPKWTLFPTPTPGGIAAAGTWRGDKFDGADTLPISQIKPAMVYWAEHLSDYKLTILDGDKLSTQNAKETVMRSGGQVRCLLISGPDGAERRALRGTTQNASWVKGRMTKSLNFWKSFYPHQRLNLKSQDGTIDQLNELTGFIGA